jgi:hypothetical protein
MFATHEFDKEKEFRILDLSEMNGGLKREKENCE